VFESILRLLYIIGKGVGVDFVNAAETHCVSPLGKIELEKIEPGLVCFDVPIKVSATANVPKAVDGGVEESGDGESETGWYCYELRPKKKDCRRIERM
jgi:hypothetical protein